MTWWRENLGPWIGLTFTTIAFALPSSQLSISYASMASLHVPAPNKFTLGGATWTQLQNLWPNVPEGQTLTQEHVEALTSWTYSSTTPAKTGGWNLLRRYNASKKKTFNMCCIPTRYERAVRHVVYKYNALANVLTIPFSDHGVRGGEVAIPYLEKIRTQLEQHLDFLNGVIEETARYIKGELYVKGKLPSGHGGSAQIPILDAWLLFTWHDVRDPLDLKLAKVLRVGDPHCLSNRSAFLAHFADV